jgi:[acyl-carrier-protein] S-malonyltransferase
VIVATVASEDIPVTEVDAREAALRGCALAGVLPVAGTREGRQLRRWLTQLLVTERVIAVEAAARGIQPRPASTEIYELGDVESSACVQPEPPSEQELLPDVTARLELGSVTSAVLSESPLARSLYALITEDVEVTEGEVKAYHARNPYRFALPNRVAEPGSPSSNRGMGAGWDIPAGEPPPLHSVRAAIAAELHAAARRRAFATWLDGRRAELVRLAPGYEHPGDPRQPDNTHRH